MSLTRELQNIGLSDKEAKVYLAALELGQASVQNIANKAKVNRATCYSVLESLINKGLCSTYDQDKKIFFIATGPDHLDSLFELKKKDIEEKQKSFKNLLPELRMVHNKDEDKPVIRFFEGKAGMLNCAAEWINGKGEKGEPVRLIYNKDLLENLLTADENKKMRDIRLKKKLKSRVMYTGTEPRGTTSDGTRIKLPMEEFPIHCDIGIYADYVRIASTKKKLSSILIKDKDIAETFKTVFELAWENALQKFVERKKKERGTHNA